VLHDDHHDLLDKHHGLMEEKKNLESQMQRKDEEISKQHARINSLEQELGRGQNTAVEKADGTEGKVKDLESLQYKVVHKQGEEYNGIYANSNGEKFNGFPVYRHQKYRSIVIYMHAPDVMQWVLQPNEPSENWSANSYGSGESPDLVAWGKTLDVTLVTESTGNEEYYEYVNARPVTWYKKEVFSWLSAGEFCKQHGDQTLCHFDEICENGIPDGGEREGDIWVPILDMENDWITLSKRPHGMCQKHSDLENLWGKEPKAKAIGPIWGDKEEKAYTKQVVPCCGTPQES